MLGVAPPGAAGGTQRGTALLPMLPPRQSVGDRSTQPYADTYGFATPGVRRGFVGPPVSSLNAPTSWYVRVGGSNNNGGSSSSLSPDRSGTDGAPNNSVFVSASANFTPGDIGKGLTIDTGASAQRFKIVGYTSATTVTLSSSYGGSGSGKTWALGGAWADPRAAVGDSNVTTNSTCGVQSGDSVYIGAGTYRTVIAIPATTAAGAFVPAFNGQVSFIGDVSGAFTGDAGMVQITAYTTNDKTAPSGSSVLNLFGKSNLSFSNIMFVGGTAIIVTATTSGSTSQNITFRDCAFLPGSTTLAGIVTVTNVYPLAINWSFDRCYFGPTTATSPLLFTMATGTGPDYAVSVYCTNCLFLNCGASRVVSLVQGTVLAGKPGTIIVSNCTTFGPGALVGISATSSSLSLPVRVVNSFIDGLGGLNSGTLGQIIEDYNLIVSTSPRTNVTAGAHSISDGSYAPLFHFGQEAIWGALRRAFSEPMAGSPLLSFGNDGGQTLYDLLVRPRPSGGGSGLPFPAVGALERGNTPVQASSPAPPSGTYAWQGTGPWYQDFLIPVPASAQTFSIYVQRDSSYSGPTLPSMLILPNGRIGVAAQTITDTGASGGWNLLTAAAITPTAVGWLTIRIVSYDFSGLSVVEFADFAIA